MAPTATQTLDLAGQAANLLHDIPASSIIPSTCLDALYRVGAELEIMAGGHRTELFELGASLKDLSGSIAEQTLRPTVALAKKVRRILRVLSESDSPMQWSREKIDDLGGPLQRALRKITPKADHTTRHVLVINSNPTSQKLICGALENAGFVATSCMGGREALERLRSHRPALIIMDVDLPDIRGPRLVRRIRRDPYHVGTPVVFVSSRKGLEEKLDAFRGGADDYITKPFHPDELVARVASRIERSTRLQEIALRDPVTGIATKRSFDELLSTELARHERYKSSFAVALINIDQLERVSDAFGFEAADEILQRVGQELRGQVRRTDLAAWLSGGEFGILLCQTNLVSAASVMKRMLMKVHAIIRGSNLPSVTLSSGVAGCPETASTRQDLLSATRDALERAKSAEAGGVHLASCGSDGLIQVPDTGAARREPSMETSSASLSELSAEEAQVLKEAFIAEISDRLKPVGNIDPREPIRDRARTIQRAAHFLAGSGPIGGYPELSTLGKLFEVAMNNLLESAVPPIGSESILSEAQECLQWIAASLRVGTYEATRVMGREKHLRNTLFTHAVPETAVRTGERPLVMVVDDEQVTQKAIKASLNRAGCDTYSAFSASEALDFVRDHVPDLIILDIMLPDMDGRKLLSTIRSNPKLQLVPVVFVTARTQLDDKVQALRAGADDYVTKPFLPEELVARVVSRLERAKVNQDLALRDGLTGLYNHRFFQERLDYEINRFARYKKPFCLTLFDLDNFKPINDQYGHQTGDIVLRALARLLLTMVRTTDVVARYGGEEFAIIYPETELSLAAKSLERLRIAVEKMQVSSVGRNPAPLQITFSAGITVSNGETKGVLIENADRALYQSKREGKNHITIHK
ncbi:MAG: diguanylate cyclase [Acidobacteriota bacterium]